MSDIIVKQANNLESDLIVSNNFRSLEYWLEYVEDEKEFNNLVKKIVRLVRGSKEYREYTKFLVTDLNINTCSLLKNVNIENASIEIHHYPFTIFDIVKIVIQHHLVNRKDFSTISIAEKVCELHYLNKVGLVPLSKTVHELYHNGKIFIDLSHVFGNVKEFINEYKDGLTEEHIYTLSILINATKNPDIEEKNKSLLELKQLTYCIGKGSYNELLTFENEASNENLETDKELDF